ncbi:MAG: hypothetical protein WCJ30_26480, partial [Deltaproteobacteria bacterium]
VMHNARPGMDMVLIRTPHPLLNRTSSVAGMSGSPIYVDDRLLGAYAYGWEFGADPIAGVTPIANMLGESHRVRRAPAGLIPGTQVPIPIAGPGETDEGRPRRRSSWETFGDRMRMARAPVASPHGAMIPLGVPLGVSGFSDGALRVLGEAFAPMGLEPVQSGGAGRRSSSSPPPGEAIPSHYENGGSVSVALVSGDISAAATGTVTLVDGNNVLAFGHPFMGLGEVSLPASLSRVTWIMVNSRRSHKMAEPIADLGALQQDRPFAIVLDERAQAPLVPIRVRVLHNDGAPRNEWNVRVAYHRSLFSRLYAGVVGTVLETAAGDSADVAWVVRSTVVTRDHGTLTFTDTGASGDGAGALSVASLGGSEAVDRLTDNPYEQVRIDRVDVDVDLRWSRDFYYIRSAALSRAEADPGDTVQLMVSFNQYGGGPPVVRSIPFTVPREVAGRDVDIEVSAGGETPGDQPEPERIDDLIRNLTSSYPEDAVVVSMRMPGQGVMLRGRVLYDLPGSALDTLRPAASTDTGEPFLNVHRSVVPIGRLVLGRDRVRLHVRDIRQ